MKRSVRCAMIGVSLALMTGCATVPRDPADRAEFKASNDPIEPLNRRLFAFNLVVDRILIKPLAKGYLRALPRQVRAALRHFLDNLDEPVVLANCILQGRSRSAAITACRFAINSTVGLAGLVDVATGQKLPKQVGDFGQTLWSWGVAEGPYLIIPVFGPESPRDGIGQGIDAFLDPLRYIPAHQNYPTAITVGRIVADGIDERARNLDSLDEIERESIDYYASFRSFYRQNRAAELRGEKPSETLPPADFYNDPGR
jgi:phospholipid-binding lipoprotein MlaA